MGLVRDLPLRELREAIACRATPAEVGEAVSRSVARLVPHDGLGLGGTDPASGFGFSTFSFLHNYHSEFAGALTLCQYESGGLPPIEELAQRPYPVGVLDGEGPKHSTRTFLAGHGIGSEMSLVLRDAHGVWGLLSLLRTPGGRQFTATDTRRILQLTPSLIDLLRRYATARPLATTTPLLPAGVLIIGPDHNVRSVTPQARTWLELMANAPNQGGSGWFVDAFPPLLSICARAHSRNPLATPARACVPATTYGRWIAIEGQPLESDNEGDLAMVIQPATGSLLLSSVCKWYGITTRERQVFESLQRGLAAKHIARQLELSVHTVNEHLRAIYRKTGVSGRDELAAALSG